MGETLYRKVGRKYEPIAWHEDSHNWPEGATLVVVTRDEGCTSMNRVKIKQYMNTAHLIAAMALSGSISKRIRKEQVPKLYDVPKKMTPSQKEAYESFRNAFKKDAIYLDYPRVEEIVEEAIREVMEWKAGAE